LHLDTEDALHYGVLQFVLYILPVFAVIYAAIYTVTLLTARAEAKKINETLQNK